MLQKPVPEQAAHYEAHPKTCNRDSWNHPQKTKRIICNLFFCQPSHLQNLSQHTVKTPKRLVHLNKKKIWHMNSWHTAGCFDFDLQNGTQANLIWQRANYALSQTEWIYYEKCATHLSNSQLKFTASSFYRCWQVLAILSSNIWLIGPVCIWPVCIYS